MHMSLLGLRELLDEVEVARGAVHASHKAGAMLVAGVEAASK